MKILMISVDAMRVDLVTRHLESLPFLKSLLSRGVFFSSSFTQSGGTYEAHGSLFTGQYPHVHKLGWELNPKVTTLFKLFHEQHYTVRAFSHLKGALIGPTEDYQYWHDGGAVEPRLDQVKAEIDQAADNTFMFLHFWHIHSPYGYSGSAEVVALHNEGKSEQVETRYYQRAVELDAMLGFLLETAVEDWCIVLFGDHGEYLNHHRISHFQNLCFHAGLLLDSVLHVPLLFHHPHFLSGRVVDTPVQHVDVFPTLLELSGLAVPSGIQGQTLVPFLVDSTVKGESRPVFSQSFFLGTRCMREYPYKLIVNDITRKQLLVDVSQNELDTALVSSDSVPELADRMKSVLDGVIPPVVIRPENLDVRLSLHKNRAYADQISGFYQKHIEQEFVGDYSEGTLADLFPPTRHSLKDITEALAVWVADKNWTQLEQDSRTAIMSYPNFTPLYYYLGMSRYFQNDYDGTIFNCEKALMNNDRNLVEILLLLSAAHQEKQQYDVSKTCIIAALNHDEGSRDAWLELAHLGRLTSDQTLLELANAQLHTRFPNSSQAVRANPPEAKIYF